jgi:hypothetical protein
MITYSKEIPAYIYCHTNIITGEFYIGSRGKNVDLNIMPENDLPRYITSSKTVKKLILENTLH